MLRDVPPSGLLSLLLDANRLRADRAAVVYNDVSTSSVEFLNLIQKLSNYLRENGIEAGDRFAYCGNNHPVILAAVFAASLLDATFVPIAAANAGGSAAQVERLGVKLFLKDDAVVSEAQSVSAQTVWESLLHWSIDSQNKYSNGSSRFSRIIFSTSGTTGNQKFVALSEAHLVANIRAAISTQNLGPTDTALSTLSICHSGGLCIQTLPALCAGARLVVASHFSVALFRNLSVKYQATVTLTVPSHLQLMKLSSLWNEDVLEKFRLIGIGSALLPLHLAKVAIEKKLRLLNIYGLTEAGPCAISGWVDANSIERDSLSIGRPHSSLEVKISNENRSGDRGEILVRGSAVQAEYLDDLGQRSSLDKEGWFATGDIAFQRGEDFILVGRRSEILNVGGMKVHPGEIEDVIAQLEGVQGCAIVTREHLVFGSILVAYLEVDASMQMRRRDIVTYCKKHLARYKVPREIVFVAALPRSAIGKILRAKLVAGAA